MRIKVAIVEDNFESAEVLQRYLKKYSRENNIIIDVYSFQDGDEIVNFYEAKFDIILLDIEMKRMDGMSAAKKIREFDKDVTIIFITNMPQYAIKGYEVKALSYLLKPVPYFAFSQEMNSSLERVKQKRESHILVTTDEGIIKIYIFDIFYIETMKHYLIIHSRDGEFKSRTSMKKMEDELKEGIFFRSNSCYLVNMDEVTGVKGDYVIINNENLKISRPRKKEFMEALASHFGGKL